MSSKSLAEILDAAQRSIGSHKRCIKDLIGLCKKSTAQAVLGTQLPAFLNLILTVYKHEPAVDRVIAFIAKFTATPDVDQFEVNGLPVYFYFIKHLLDLTNSSATDRKFEEVGKAIRLRSCQLIGSIMSLQPDNRDIESVPFEN